MATTGKATEVFEVTLNKDHTDGGTAYKAGDKIMVDASTRDILRQLGVID